MELAQDAGELLGLPRDGNWTAHPVGDLGFAIGPGIGRANLAFAVSARGQLAWYAMSVHSPQDALQIMAAIPDDVLPPAPEMAPPGFTPRQLDRDGAQALFDRFLAGENPSHRPIAQEFTDWQVTEFPDRGWLFQSGTARIIVACNGRAEVLHPGMDPEMALGRALVVDLEAAKRAAGGPVKRFLRRIAPPATSRGSGA